jgi:hypothetical protein
MAAISLAFTGLRTQEQFAAYPELIYSILFPSIQGFGEQINRKN